MKELYGNLWEVPCDLRVITTNGVVNSSGAAVMGRGCAREAKERFPGLEHLFARMLKKHGNRVMRLRALPDGSHLATFPSRSTGARRPCRSSSAAASDQLVAVADKFGYERVALPRPGCGNGRLRWTEVKGLLEPILDGRFTVVSK